MAETEPAAPPAPARRSGRARFVVLTVFTAVVLVACAALTAVAAVQLHHRSQTDDRQQAALAAARQVAVDFTTVDYRHLKADFARTAKLATPTLSKNYLAQSTEASSYITKAKAVSKGSVASSALSKISPNSATVLVAVNETVTNTSTPKGAVQYYRLSIGMTRSGSHWLASAVSPV
jgi:Mce-associated membrane protein